MAVFVSKNELLDRLLGCYRDPSTNGLSPRARGNPTSLPTERCLAGSIPACAGEPPLIAMDNGPKSKRSAWTGGRI